MRKVLTLLFGLFALHSFAQESPHLKFGKITAENLRKKVYSIDSSAKAVVLSDIGDAAIEGNSKGWFSVLTSRHKVVHILNKNGYDEADVEIPLYTNDNGEEERLESVKAVTYNLEGGEIIESKLERKNVFTEKRNKNLIIKKFTLPNVKEGCIIEFEYKVSSDFIQHIDPWLFQGSLPALWNEFKFSVPQFFSYAFLTRGYLPVSISDKKDRSSSFSVRESGGTGATQAYTFNAGVTDYRWVIKDVPELKEENFTSTLENHVSKIEFQLSSQSHPLSSHSYMGTWTGLTKELLSSEYFGNGINGSNGWLSDEVKPMFAATSSELDKAQKIYRHVRDGYSTTSQNSIYTEQSLKNTFKTKKGRSSEINLLLTAMLRNAGLQADPVILSRASRGYVYDLYPMITRFNYVVSQVKIGDAVFYLDASHSHLGFGKLLPECYNGHARVVNEEATPLYLMADSLKERKVTALFLTKGDKGGWKGHMSQTPGYYESYKLRDRIKEKGEPEFFKGIEKEYSSEVKIANGHVDSLLNYDEPIGIRYDIDYVPEADDVLYVSPMFGEGYKKNPFTAAERFYPVEMPYAMDETYVLNLEVPDGYVVDELPKQMLAKYDEEGTSYFEYRLQQSGSIISLRSRIKLSRAFYEPDEYEGLRAFFAMVVKKHGEQIVFKKKK
ncbi:MAG TPA: transglutaminase domain-containing protein [Flavisolibacter sp.]|nr:transglutaminase domain-containing protein [Flavisolibacter sp.]